MITEILFYTLRCEQMYCLALNIWSKIRNGSYINCTVRRLGNFCVLFPPRMGLRCPPPSQLSSAGSCTFCTKKRDQSRSLFRFSQRTGHSISSCLFCRSSPRWISFSRRIWTSSKKCILFSKRSRTRGR